MSRILAFDLATFAGVAWRGDDGTVWTRAIDLREMAGIKKSHAAREHSKLFAALYRLIGDVMTDMELVGKIDVFSIEDDTGRNKATSALLAGYRAIVHLKATERKTLTETTREAIISSPATHDSGVAPILVYSPLKRVMRY